MFIKKLVSIVCASAMLCSLFVPVSSSTVSFDASNNWSYSSDSKSNSTYHSTCYMKLTSISFVGVYSSYIPSGTYVETRLVTKTSHYVASKTAYWSTTGVGYNYKYLSGYGGAGISYNVAARYDHYHAGTAGVYWTP